MPSDCWSEQLACAVTEQSVHNNQIGPSCLRALSQNCPLLTAYNCSKQSVCSCSTSTEANGFWLNCTLIRGIDQLHSTNTWPGALQVYRGWNKQPYNCSKQSVCPTSLDKNAVAHSEKKVPLFFNFNGTLVSCIL
jgi:hypothetical protein